ncbi:cupin domain-containing protein [Natronobacterium texcoconense]|uniref:Cupin domain-containing protein n=1 Tax=Natronobacterium texcoconense TaxID=1095778 RepID=A0A1H1HJC4_NATTX|nr:cupin domain-containing protein [Natronobacterium texcoconense]SDR25615.1 Cupin domain-containing protein [Natronobacterium texcoconense]
MPATTIGDERTYDDDQFTTREISRTERSKTVCGYFEPGQFIPVHSPDSDVTIVVQSGSGIVRDGNEEHDVSPGSLVTIPAGQDRGIRADDERLEAVLVVAPPPTDAEHDPVRRGLQNDEFEPER